MEQPNLSYIHSMSGGDKDFEERLLDIIKHEFSKEKDVYFSHIESNDYVLCANHVHKLKHKIGILGLEKSYEIAVCYENNLLKGSTTEQDKFEVILKTMTNYLENL